MDLKNLTKEQLEAMGLTEEQIKGILNAASANESAGGLPFPQLKINYDMELGKAGAYAYNPIKEDKETVGYEFAGSPVKVRFLKSMYQYSKFDATQNKPVITSNVFELKNAKKAYDLKTGKSISALKALDDQIKFQRILLGVIEIDGEEKPFIFYTKGSFLYELSNILKDYDNDGHLTHYFTLSSEKRKKGTVIWFVPVLENAEQLSQQDFVKNLKSDADYILKFDKWVEQINSSGEIQDEEPNKQVTTTQEVEEDEDNIAF